MLAVGRAAWLALVLLFSAIVVTTRADACLATSVSVGVDFSCALLADASVRCWGNSANGRLGRNNVTMSDLIGPPLAFGSGRSVLQLAAHADYTCALLDDHSVSCWGKNDQGQLGTGDTNDRTQPTPVQLGLVNQTVQLLSTGDSTHHTCIVTTGRDLIAWGWANELVGTPWLGSVSSSASGDVFIAPHQVNFSLGHGDLQGGVSICSGWYHTCVLTNHTGLKCWGTDPDQASELGLGTLTDTTRLTGSELPAVHLGKGRSPVAMSCGGKHTCAILDDGVLKCWGDNEHGQLGYGDPTNRGASDADMGDNLKPVDVGTGRKVKQVSCGTWHTCVILDNDQVKCWGRNDGGQLGHHCSVTQWGDQALQMGDNLTVVDLGQNRTALSLSGSDSHTCAVLDNGSIKCWGDSQLGKLGFFPSGGCGPSQAVDLGSDCKASSVVLSNNTARGNNNTGSGSNNNSGGNNRTASGTNTGSGSNGTGGGSNSTNSGSGGVTAITTNSPSLVQQSASATSTSTSHSISGGAIAGAVIASMVGVILVGAGVWWWRTKQGSSRQQAAVTRAAGVGRKQHSAGVVVVVSDEAVVNGLEEGLVHTAADVQQHTGCCTWASRSTTSTTPDAKGRGNGHRTPNAGDPSPGLVREGSVEDMCIPWSQLIVGRVLGEGGFGTVYKARWQAETVAVKLLNVRNTATTAINNLYREALIMSQLRHPCIARVFGIVDEDPHHALVMQYYPKGTLAKYMMTLGYAELQIPVKLHIARQIASGMRFMHERTVPILHGDLKAANILLTGPGRRIAIADFGLSQAMLAGQEAAVASGALTYSISPPEVLNDPLAPRTHAADVYAFAIVLLEIYTGKRAFGNLGPKQIRMLVTSGGRPTLPTDMPPCIATIIQSCWAQDPAARPSFAVVAQQLTAAYEDLQFTHMTDSTKTLDGTQTMTDW